MLSYRYKNFSKPQRDSHISNRRTHLANERTFLAWIRTSIAVMGFGFMVEKFSIFYQHYMDKQFQIQPGVIDPSEIIGIILVSLGCMTGILAVIRYLRTERDIEKDRFRPSIVIDLLFVAILLILVGFLAMYLLNSRMFSNG